ncbi:MAG: response regulator [Ruminococcus sp.]|jgi:two-component system chemotaxis response regulator CheY|nr:response regulator [Ruminococcus sp.]
MFTGLKVLLCDDSLMIIKKMSDVMRSLGVGIVQTALDGEQAVKLYKMGKPDVVFMDQVMPNKAGLVALQEIIDYHPDAIVYMLSSMGTIGKREEAEKIGARDFLQKPVTSDDIKTVLEDVVKELANKKQV